MNRITTATSHRIVTAAIKFSWAVQTAGERKQALGERAEAWAHRLAVRGLRRDRASHDHQ